TLQLAMEYAGDGIRFNAVAPGVVETPLQRGQPVDGPDERFDIGGSFTHACSKQVYRQMRALT
ncbi:MAG: SDR family oxidoreductase, partial [Gemmatimonadaceae bacterium]